MFNSTLFKIRPVSLARKGLLLAVLAACLAIPQFSSARGSFRSGGSFGSFGGATRSFRGSSSGSFSRTGPFGVTRTFKGTSAWNGTSRSVVPPPIIGRSNYSYSFGGASYNAYRYGGWSDYSYGWARPAWYFWTPFHPAFYFAPPYYYGGYYYPGHFLFFRLLIGIAIVWIIIALIARLFRRATRVN